MKKILLTAVCLTLLTVPALAQIKVVERATDPLVMYSEKKKTPKQSKDTKNSEQTKKKDTAPTAGDYHDRFFEENNDNKKMPPVKEDTKNKTSEAQATPPVKEPVKERDLSSFLPMESSGSSKSDGVIRLDPITISR